MKLSKLYCSDKRFNNIQFHLKGLNVIYADVQTKEGDKKNSHDLGKTKFAEIIDFLLLKGIDKNHFLKRIKKDETSLFENHIFYLELYLNSEQYLTIKRAVEKNTKISFSLNEQTTTDFIPPLNWKKEDITLDKAKSILSGYLAMDFFHNKKYNYRKSISYSLRKQDDFKDVYKLNKFALGKDIDWKPFVFDLLGFKGELLTLKYDNDSKIEGIKNSIKSLEEDFFIKTEDRDNLVGEIKIKKNEIEEVSEQIDKFNFYQQDKQLIEKGIDDIENKIGVLNNDSYRLNYDIKKIESSIQNNFSFNIKKVEKIFEETKIYFPEQLSTDYKNLIDFNKKLTTERNKLLKQTKLVKEEQLKQVNKELEILNKKRENLLSHLSDSDTFKKFKTHQKTLSKQEGDLSKLEQKLETIDSILEKKKEIQKLKNSILSTVNTIKNLINKTEHNEKYNEIRNHFTNFYKEIMNENAILSLSINSNDNIDFLPPKVKSRQDNKINTAKDEGNTYKKLLCVVFDLAIIKAYSNESYYRFIYHDDVISQQDNGIKTRLLELLRKITQETNTQYILSIIKSDLPVDENYQPTYFKDDEIILKLHDKNLSGTLFGFEF